MPQKVEYVDFEAKLPGDHDKDEVRMCMGYQFVGGFYRARMKATDAVKAGRVLNVYFGCDYRRVENVSEAEENSAPEGEEGSTQEVDSKSGEDVGRSEGDADDGDGTTTPKARTRKRKTAPKDGEKRPGNPDEGSADKTDELV